MNLLQILFYSIAALILTSTAFAVTRRSLVYAVIYLVLSFFGSAMLFYLLGAPLLAALEIIIYAGAIMVLFLFIIMMVQVEKSSAEFMQKRQFLPAAMISGLFLAAFHVLARSDMGGWEPMAAAQAVPKAFGIYLFQTHWLAIEVASMLLLVALIGAIVLGIRAKRSPNHGKEERTS